MSDTATPTTRALSGGEPTPLARSVLAYHQMDLGRVAQHLYALLLRNVSSDGFPFTDSTHQLVSLPGCVIAAPSYPANAPGISQDYVFNWVRDAADRDARDQRRVRRRPTVGERWPTMSGSPMPASRTRHRPRDTPASPSKPAAALVGAERRAGDPDRGAAGRLRQLDPDTRSTATDLIARNLDFLLGCYRDPTTNLWEEHRGYSFFARAGPVALLP